MSFASFYPSRLPAFVAIHIALFFSSVSGAEERAEVLDFPVFSAPDSELKIRVLTSSIRQGAVVASCGDVARLVGRGDVVCAGYTLAYVDHEKVVLLGDRSRGERVHIYKNVENREGHVLVMYALY